MIGVALRQHTVSSATGGVNNNPHSANGKSSKILAVGN